jgi:nucleoside phosphorylase
VCKDMLRTFKSIRFGLLVGIGGGVPSATNDIRLGDVVVSQPNETSGGVIQYDKGKAIQGGEFRRTGALNSPPMVLLAALARLQAEHEASPNKILQYLSEMMEKYPRMKREYAYQEASNDRLYQAAYDHPGPAATCEECDRAQEIRRDPREDAEPRIHYGNIASGNQEMEHGATRERLRQVLEVLCFETEAAGLMSDFPCLVIRGICDYSDSHKNKKWQKYAAATAAGFAKELLCGISAELIRRERTILQVSGK